MNCSKCGTDNREGARFCRACGHELSQEAVPDVRATTFDGGAMESSVVVADVGESEPGLQAPVASSVEESSGDQETVATDVSATDAGSTDGIDNETGGGEEPATTSAEERGLSGDAEAESMLGGDESEGVEEDVAESADTPVEAQAPVGSESPDESVWEDADLLPDLDDDAFAFWREDVEPLTAEVPGTVLAHRYLVVDVVDEQDTRILYHVQDLGSCWHCGFEGNAPDETYCARCGATQDRRPIAHLLEVSDGEASLTARDTVVSELVADDRTFLVLAEPESKPVRPAARSIRLLVGQQSDAGQVRELDEDSLLAFTLAPTYESRTWPVIGLFAVADGMGGHEGGEVASRLSLQVLSDRVMRTIVMPLMAGEMIVDGDISALLRQATMAANDEVYLARMKRNNDMGTTLTTALVLDQRLFLAHVGDCRAYLWNADGLKVLTTDHSIVASMIADGRAAPEEIYTHPHRSIIYRCIGDKPTIDVDTDIHPLAAGDRIIVCCDGLWEMVRDEGIADVMMQEADPQVACDLLVKHANAAGGEDNISVIVIQVAEV